MAVGTSETPWREARDPFALPMTAYRVERVLDYPHAGNDVFHVAGIHDFQSCAAYVKVERQAGADVKNEIALLRVLPYDKKPRLLDWSLEAPVFDVTEECPGRRLSVILQDAPPGTSLRYMASYGAELARVHALDMAWEPVKPRRFFDRPGLEYIQKYGLEDLAALMDRCSPAGESRCFVHGDFHYANILWQDGAVSAVLDWELAGSGVREFDMAWAVLLRPGQKFLDTPEEIEAFLAGYGARQDFSRQAFTHYYIQAALWFAALGDEDYRQRLASLCRAAAEAAA